MRILALGCSSLLVAMIAMTWTPARAADGVGKVLRVDDPQVGTPCSCDCDSYCKDVARRYADEHIHYPDWYGSGNPTKIPVTILESSCQYSPEGPCNFSCWVKTRKDDDGAVFWIIVLLYAGAQYHVTTSTGMFALCSYNPQCPGPTESGMKLIPAGCTASN